jgi:hypothetical protein
VRDARAVDQAVLSRPGRVQNALLFTTAYIPMQSFVNGASNGASNANDANDAKNDFNANTTVGGCYKSNAVVPHRLKAPGFNQ